jgi:hypothetical protein
MPLRSRAPAPSLLEQVRGLIERTYDHQTGLGPLAPFIIGDEGYRRVCTVRRIVRCIGAAAGAAEGDGAQLLLSQEPDGTWKAALYFPDDLIAALEAHPPTRGIDARNLAAFAAFIEEIDHLLLVAARLRGGPDLTLLELELHANVTKDLVVRHFLGRTSRSPGSPRVPGAWVRHHLFVKPTYCDPDPAIRDRYRDATALALRYLDRLSHLPLHERVTDLRRFSRLSHHAKIRLLSHAA